MPIGQSGNVDVPKRAIQAEKIIYEGSKLLSVMQQAGIPMRTVEQLDVIEDVTRGTPGEDDVAIDAAVAGRKLTYEQIRTSIKWTNFTYDVLESAKINARDLNAVWRNNMMAASEYFATARDYRILSDVKAKAGLSGAATALWTAADAEIESDVVDAINSIYTNSNCMIGENFSLVLPVDVFSELNKLTLIKNIQRTMGDYLKSSFKLDILPYRPAVNDGKTKYMDGLENDALLFVKGAKTAELLEYSPAKARSLGVRLVEETRLPGRGDQYIQKMGTACLTKWDGLGTYTSSTDYVTNRVYKITDVKA